MGLSPCGDSTGDTGLALAVLPPASLTPVSLCCSQVEAVISKHRAELLAERYHFNLGLLMGEWGHQGRPCLMLVSVTSLCLTASATVCSPGS